MGLAGVILAAGESTRMGQDKALLPWPPDHVAQSISPETLLSTVIRAFSAICDLVIVVAGKNRAELAPVIYANGASLVENPSPERGQFSSLQIGLREVLNRGWDNVMLTLVDRPGPAASTLQTLAEEFGAKPHDVWAIVPEYQGKHGHPVMVGRELIEEFLKAPASGNAREIEHAHQQRIRYVPVDDPFVTMNINTPEDYASLKSGFGL